MCKGGVITVGVYWAGGEALLAIGTVKPCSNRVTLIAPVLLVPRHLLSTLC